jgi:hypothetical protein
MKFDPNKAKKAIRFLLIVGTITLGIVGGLLVWRAGTTQKTELEKIEALLTKYQKTRANVPPATDRDFWQKQIPKPEKIDPRDFNKNAYTTIETGTLQICYYNDPDWIPKVEEALLSILPYQWHDSRNFEQEVLDLAATSWAATLAHSAAVLEGTIKDEIINKIREEVKRKILEPYKKEYEKHLSDELAWGQDKAPWLGSTGNWSAVCTANIIYSALATLESTKEKAEYVKMGLKSIEDYLKGFEDDGYLTSGMRYWTYGFRHLVFLSERLLQVTGQKIDLYKNNKVKELALFPLAWQLSPNVQDHSIADYPVFTDNFQRVNKELPTWDILSLRYNTPWNHREGSSWGKVYNENLSQFGAWQMAKSINYKKIDVPNKEMEGLISESSGVIKSFSVDGKICLVTKGGSNGEEHNHNDVGSYILYYKEGDTWKWIAGDPGMERYGRENFRSKRYEIDIISSYGHPVPSINGSLQATGTERTGKMLNFQDNKDKTEVTYELKDAYSLQTLDSVKRTISFNKIAGIVTIQDSTIAKSPVELETAIILRGSHKTENLLSMNLGGIEWGINYTSTQPVELSYKRISGWNGQQNTRLSIKTQEKAQESSITYSIGPIVSKKEELERKRKDTQDKLEKINKL